MTYHHEIPVNDFRYLSTEEVLDLDWSDPWYSAFRNRNLRRQYDAPMNAFLYVEPYEVRTEIIARPLDLQRWVDLGLEGLETIPVEMQYELNQKVAAFLGRAPEPDHRRTARPARARPGELSAPNAPHQSVIDPPEELDIYSATLGVIFVHPTEGLPQEASLTWDLFDERIQRVPGAATDEAGPLRFFLVPDDNILWWKNFLKNPTIPTLVELAPPPSLGLRVLGWSSWLILVLFLGTIVMMVRTFVRERTVPRRAITVSILLLLAAGAAFAATLPSRMTDEKAEGMVAGLLHNIYRAFDFRGEEAIYDVPRSQRQRGAPDRDLSRDPARAGAGQSGRSSSEGQGHRAARGRVPATRGKAGHRRPHANGTSPDPWATGVTSTRGSTSTRPT